MNPHSQPSGQTLLQSETESGINIPDNWMKVCIRESNETPNVVDQVKLKHAHDDYTLTIFRDHESGSNRDSRVDRREKWRWDGYYLDPDGTKRDALNRPKISPQKAIDEATEFIKTRRAKKRHEHFQKKESKEVSWPSTIGLFRLIERESRPQYAKYHCTYLNGYTVLGVRHRDLQYEIRYTKENDSYLVRPKKRASAFDESDYVSKKATAIERAKEMMEDKSAQIRSIEEKVVAENPVPDYRIPSHIKNSSV